LIMLVLLRRSMGSLRGQRVGGLLLKAVAASAVMGGAVQLAAAMMTRIVPGGLVGEVLLVGGSGLVGAAIYAGLAVLLQMEEVGLVGQAVIEWSRRLTGPGQ
jgi:peptidoglycan biosynthesis protein MviN/MurJ (putative lipid II flippase)